MADYTRNLAGLAALLLGLTGMLAAPVHAAELFRYRNSSGVTVLSNTIPAEFAAQGYAVIDHRGRVVRVVPRQLSDAEIQVRAQEQAVVDAAQQARLMRRQEDEELLRLYSTPDDVERALERKLASIQGAISTVEANIQRLRSQKRNLQTQAADIERSGGVIPANIISAIGVLDDQIDDKQNEIDSRQTEIAATRNDYAQDRDRLRYLLGLTDEA